MACPNDGVIRTAGTTPASPSDRAALAAALDPIVTIDHLGIVQSVSDSIERVLGWEPAALIGKNVSVLMPEPIRSAHDGYLRRYMETGVTGILNRPRRFDAMHLDGTLVPIELSVSRADIPGQPTPLFVGIIRAVAERTPDDGGEQTRLYRLLAEQTSALQTAHHRLRMADRMASIGSLAAGLGHDMNNVLLPVRARLNALRAATLGDTEREHVEGINKSIAYLQQLADGLHFLAMDPDGEAVDDEETDLHAWWEQTGALLSKAVPKHVRVEASIAPDLPPVTVAAHALTQAMLNLVVNAGEAIPNDPRHAPGCVSIRARMADDDHVELAVADNGIGMSAETRRRAFELFFTTKTRGLGTGLGLALVHKVAERAGARIEMESREGAGTTVRLLFAANRPDAAANGPTAVITLRDGRAAAMVRNVLELSGATASLGEDPGGADIWVIDPNLTSVDAARAWRATRTGAQLVVFGKAMKRPEDWAALKPITVEATDDFNAVRAAIGSALE
jgi:PAS domain S-box-containing protein